jgi:hypothetical protein
MGDNHTVIAERAGNNRGRHARTARAIRAAKLIDSGVGCLDEAWQENGMGFAAGSGAKTGKQRFDGSLRGNLALLLTADSVREDEEPALRVALGFIVGEDVAGKILIVVAYAAYIGHFGELEIQHGGGRCGQLSFQHNLRGPGQRFG